MNSMHRVQFALRKAAHNGATVGSTELMNTPNAHQTICLSFQGRSPAGALALSKLLEL